MSWHYPGIHLFYPNEQTLAHAFFDGLGWTGGQPITIEGAPSGRPTPINSGVSAVYLQSENKIYVFYTGKDNHVYVMAYALDTSTLQYIMDVPDVRTTDVTAPVDQSGNICLYYKDAVKFNHGGPAYTVLKCSGNTMSVVAAPVSAAMPGQPTSWGPAVVMRGGSPNMVYGDSNNVLKMAWQAGTSSWAQIDPQGAWLSYTPAAVLAGDDIVVLYHAKKGHDLYCNFCDPSGNWTQNVANRNGDKNQDYIVGGGPGACVFGGKIYCFMQGPNNQMYCQIYMGHEWRPQPLLVTDGNGNSLCSNVWWGPAAVAV